MIGDQELEKDVFVRVLTPCDYPYGSVTTNSLIISIYPKSYLLITVKGEDQYYGWL